MFKIWIVKSDWIYPLYSFWKLIGLLPGPYKYDVTNARIPILATEEVAVTNSMLLPKIKLYQWLKLGYCNFYLFIYNITERQSASKLSAWLRIHSIFELKDSKFIICIPLGTKFCNISTKNIYIFRTGSEMY